MQSWTNWRTEGEAFPEHWFGRRDHLFCRGGGDHRMGSGEYNRIHAIVGRISCDLPAFCHFPARSWLSITHTHIRVWLPSPFCTPGWKTSVSTETSKISHFAHKCFTESIRQDSTSCKKLCKNLKIEPSPLHHNSLVSSPNLYPPCTQCFSAVSNVIQSP